ncbi:MAG: GIY-YIG nuclease family protein [Saprospiraceae bacterium]|nr:GIY-YIG nuclease family protein [Saprospiraceae bacterium]
MYYVYIIYSSGTDRYYKGITQNVEKRVAEHNKGLSRYTKDKGPWELVYSKAAGDKSSALIEEKRLKRLNRQSIIKLMTESSENNQAQV